MHYYFTAVSLVAGICLGFGIAYLFVGLRRKDNKALNLTFAIFALCYAATLFNGIRWYSTTSVSEFIAINRFDSIFVTGAFVSLIWFISLYTGFQPRIFLWVLSAVFIVTSLVFLISQEAFTGEISGLSYIILPWGEKLADLESAGSIWLDINFLARLVTLGYIIFAIIRQYWLGERQPAIILGLGILPFIVGIFYEVLGESGLVPYIPFGEFGFLGIAIAASLQMANSVIETEEALEQYQRNLEKLVKERTTKLEQTNLQLTQEINQRQLVEADLRQSERQARALLNAPPDTAMLLEPDGTILEINEIGTQRLGVSMLEAIGINIFDLLEPEVREPRREKFEEVKITKQPVRWEDTRGGMYFDNQLFPILDDEGSVASIAVFASDNTERKMAQIALVESEEKFRNLAEQSPNMIFINQMGRVVYANRMCVEVMGYSLEEFYSPDFDFFSLIAQNSLDLVKENFQSHLSGQDLPPDEYELVTKDGALIQVIIAPKIIKYGEEDAILGIVTDITGLKHVEKELQQRVDDLDMLNQVGHVVTSIADVLVALECISEIITGHYEARYTHIIMFGDELDGVKILVGYDREIGNLERSQLDASIMGESVLKQLDDIKESLVVSEIQDASWPIPLLDLLKEYEVQTAMMVPIKIRGNLAGFMAVTHDQPEKTFTQGEVKLAETVSREISQVIENSHHQAQERQAAAGRERRRLARDLHDSVTQTMYSVSIVAEALPRLLNRDFKQAKDSAVTLRQMTLGALAEMRTLLFELRPEALEKANLSNLLGQLADILTGQTYIPVDLQIDVEPDLPVEVKIDFYRVAQEAFSNIRKHAQATQVSAILRADPELVVLTIQDNGRGFNPQAIPDDKMGLRIMMERAREIGAKLDLESKKDKGSMVKLSWEMDTIL